MLTFAIGLLALSLAGGPASGAPAPGEAVVGLALDRRPDLLTGVELPDRSRDDLSSGPVEVHGPWRLVASVGGVRTWQTALPVRPRTLFFSKPPEGMALLQREGEAPWDGTSWDGARTLGHDKGLGDAGRADSWEFSSHALWVRRPAAAGPPAPGEYAVRFDKAVQRERDLQRGLFEGDDTSFVMRALQVDDTTRHGLLLPAPSTATFSLTLPEGAVFTASPGLLPPETAPPLRQSDGAELVVLLDGAELGRHPLYVGEFDAIRHDLSPWAGQQVQLELRVEPGGTPDLDYAFVATPVVYTPQPEPQRVVILFVDTLRADGLSMYGYARPTTPRLDAWAAGGAVFEQARSVAPWTLPSTRAMFLGTQPERWTGGLTLQERAAAAGWATAFISGNVYLSSNFDMDRGWGTHRCINWPTADVQVRRARQWLAEHPDRPALLVLHLMDMHLPYTEPRAYRHLFAGEHFEELGPEDFLRSQVTRAASKIGAEGKQYIRDRYDNNLRYVDDQLADFLALLDDRDTVVLLSDHGEEFWDHHGFEHGHSLYEELLDVPLVVRGPGVAAGRVDLPVSLLDVAPTLAQAMGLDRSGMTGLPLQGAADGSAADAFDGRPIGFGRPLYGQRMWGVVDGDLKYTTADGAERVFDLAADPGEKTDLVLRGGPDRDALARLMGTALEHRVVTALRLDASRSSGSHDLVVTARVPGGIDRVWAAEDPLSYATVTIDDSVDSEATITWVGATRGSREVYLLPKEPLDQVLPGVEIVMRHRGPPVTLAPARRQDWPQPWNGRPTPLLRGRADGRTLTVDYARVPVPEDATTALVGVDPELQEDLKALGYFDDH